MKKKKLIILAIIIFILLIALLFFATNANRSGKTNNNSDFTPNTGEVFNQGSSVLQYEDNAYIVDEISNTILKYKIGDNTYSRKMVNISKNSIYNQLYIINNNLIFSDGENTYYTDLNGKNLSKFCTGKVVYIDENVYVYIVQKYPMQYLYISSYNNKTFRSTNDIGFNLAKGYKIEFIKENDGVLYFASRNSDESTTLFSVDLNENKTELICEKEVLDIDTQKVSFSDIVKLDGMYYYIVDNIKKTTYDEMISSSTLWYKAPSSLYEEVYKDVVGRKFIVNPKNKKEVLYEEFNSETNKYEWKTILEEGASYTWKEVLYGDVTKYFKLSDENVILMDDEKLISLNTNYKDYWIDKVIRIKDGFIILLINDSSNYNLYFSKEDGSEFFKIY